MIFGFQNGSKIEEKMLKMRCSKQYTFESIFLGIFFASASKNGAKVECVSDFYHLEVFLYNMNFLQNEIVLGVLVFTIAVNLMVFVILGARRLLVSSGNVSISMNDAAKSLEVEAGGKLLQTLAAQNFFLSSACGGGGTCAQCKCQVVSGGGSILPTEESHFTNKEKKE